jgi:hypothetical protein
MSGLRSTVLVARTELRRSVRRQATLSVRSVVLLGGGGLALLAYSLGGGVLAFFGGRALAGGATVPSDATRGVVAAFFLGMTFFSTQRVVKTAGTPDASAGVLTATSHRSVLSGLVLAELIRYLAVVTVPGVTITGGLALGLGSPTAVVWVLALGLAVTVLAVLTGFVLGLASKNVAARSRFVERHRGMLGAILTLCLLGGYVALVSGQATATYRAAAAFPVGWVADLAGVVLPGVPTEAGRAVAAAVVLSVGGPVGMVLADQLAGALWFVDRVRTDRPAGTGGGPLDAFLPSGLHRVTRAVAKKSVRRARRAPFTVQYAVAPVFGLVYPLSDSITAGAVQPSLPVALSVVGVWATGASFALNPLGAEGSVLPAVLTAGTGGRRFLSGVAVACLVVGAPVAVLVTGVTAALSMSPSEAALWVGTTLALCPVATALAAGVGVYFPKSETTSLGRGREAVVPSAWAFLFYSLVLGAVVLPAAAVSAFSVAGPAAAVLGVPAATVTIGAHGLTVGLGTVLAVAGYRNAVRVVDGYRLD